MKTVKAAFRAKALELHPDMQGDDAGGPADDTAFKQAAANYQLLLEAIAAPADRTSNPGGGGGGGGGEQKSGGMSSGEAMEQQQRQARAILEEIKRNPAAYLAGFEKAKRQDAITRRRLAAAAAAEEGAFEPSRWSTGLRDGWSETGSITARANSATGYTLVKTVTLQVAPLPRTPRAAAWPRRALCPRDARLRLHRAAGAGGCAAHHDRLHRRARGVARCGWARQQCRGHTTGSRLIFGDVVWCAAPCSAWLREGAGHRPKQRHRGRGVGGVDRDTRRQPQTRADLPAGAARPGAQGLWGPGLRLGARGPRGRGRVWGLGRLLREAEEAIAGCVRHSR